MPIPKPENDEEKQQFINRCMSDETMKNEYPERKQRAGVCYTQWRENHQSSEQNQNEVEMNSLHHNMNNLVRWDKLDGKDYLVAPTVMLVEGVLNDIYYPAEEMSVCPQQWNEKPVVVEHSVKTDGSPKSACSPQEREKRTVGFLFNTYYDSSKRKLHSEAWIDPDKCKKVEDGQVILNKLENNEPIEVSTGVFTLDMNKPGEFQGEEYNAIATELRGDHLALLPNGTGACSWTDGAGMPRINQKKENSMTKNKEDKTFLQKLKEKFSNLISNERSITDTLQEVRWAVINAYENTDVGKFVWVEDVFENSVIFQLESNDTAPFLYKQEWKRGENDEVVLDGEPKEVEMKVDYVPKEQERKEKENQGMTHEEKVQYLIDNNQELDENSKQHLQNLPDSVLDIQVQAVQKQNEGGGGEEQSTSTPSSEQKSNEETKEEGQKSNEGGEQKSSSSVQKEQEVKNNQPSVQQGLTINTEDDLINALPEGELKHGLQEARDSRDTEKHTLVERLVQNANCDYQKEELQNFNLNDLRRIAKMARVPNYAGSEGAPAQNSSGKRKSVPMPELNWEQDGKVETKESDK